MKLKNLIPTKNQCHNSPSHRGEGVRGRGLKGLGNGV